MTQMQYFRYLENRDPDIIGYAKKILNKYPKMNAYETVSGIAWEMIAMADEGLKADVDKAIERYAADRDMTSEQLIEKACKPLPQNITAERIEDDYYVSEQEYEQLKKTPIQPDKFLCFSEEGKARADKLNAIIEPLEKMGEIEIEPCSVENGCASISVPNSAIFGGVAKDVLTQAMEFADTVTLRPDMLNQRAVIDLDLAGIYL